MLNILDIILARNASFSSETAKLVKEAKEAMAKANEVAGIITSAEEALEVASQAEAELSSLADTITELRSDTEEAIIKAEEAHSAATSAQEVAESALTSIDVTTGSSNSYHYKQIKYVNNGTEKTVSNFVEKNYTGFGSAEDGGMTQKAITHNFTAMHNELTSMYNELSSEIAAIEPGGGGSISGNPGAIVIIDEDGTGASGSTINVGTLSKMSVISGTFLSDWASYDIAGVELDYENNNFTKVLQPTIGAQTGRTRVAVEDNGHINFKAGNNGWEEFGQKNPPQDVEYGAYGQIMVYQPKFYYMRVPIKTDGNNILKEYLFISDLPYDGFELHPAFYDKNGTAVDYILLSAYEGCLYNPNTSSYIEDDSINSINGGKLSSIVNVKPTTRNTSVEVMETLAQNRGQNWHMENIYIKSLQQMLMIVEFGFINMYERWNYGISNITNYSSTASVNSACLTGSTSNKYNTTARADSTVQTYPGVIRNYTNDGCCAITYRGYENPYGNLWTCINGITVNVNSNTCNIDGVDLSLNSIPSSAGFIKYFNKLAPDWLFFPLDVSGNSSVSTGDYYIYENSQYVVCGGRYSTGSKNGIFTFGIDNPSNVKYTVRLCYIPNKNDAYYYPNLHPIK